MPAILQPPEVDLGSLGDDPFSGPEPFLSAEKLADMEREAMEAAERKEQERYDVDERRKQVARDAVRREREEARISGHLSDEAQLFFDLSLTPRLNEIHEYEQKVRVPVIQGTLFQDSLAWIAGPSGTFKSFVAADLAFRYGSDDLDYHGRRMTTGRSLLVIAEGSGGYADRRVAWEREHEREVKGVVIYPAPLQLGDTLKEMPALIHYLKQEAEAGRPFGLVVFDTQAMCTVGIDENTSEMNLIINVLHRIREVNGACVLTVHHFGKNERSGMRGSSMIYAAADTVITIEREKESMLVTLSTGGENGKQKDAVTEKDFLTLQMKSMQVGLDYFNDPVSSLVPVPADAPVLDAPEEVPVELPDVTEPQMDHLKLIGFYEHRGATPSDMAAKLIEERGPIKNARQNVRNRMVELAKLNPPLVEPTAARGGWRITPMGVAVIARQVAVGEQWVERAGRKSGFRGQVSKGQRNLDSETSET